MYFFQNLVIIKKGLKNKLQYNNNFVPNNKLLDFFKKLISKVYN